MWEWSDTIVALASPPGVAERGIVRLTGPGLSSLLGDWCRVPPEFGWQSTAAARIDVELPLPDFRHPLHCGLQWWPTARSYTGQPAAEFHLIGAPPVLSSVVSEACRRGARMAQPGEFTLRAFLAGRLDLLQAEAVLGVIDADNQRSLQTALEQLAGGISQRMVTIRQDLLELLADIEAGLDFVEEHLEFVGRDVIQQRIAVALEFTEQLWEHAAQRMHSGERPRVVLAGLPNAGKSTLFNRLLHRDQALVSATAGTTRDYLTAAWDCAGLTVDLVDTAGWDLPFTVEGETFRLADRGSDEQTATHSGPERPWSSIDQAMQAARADQIGRADVIVWCAARDQSPEARRVDARCRSQLSPLMNRVLTIATKSDTGGPTGGDIDGVLAVSSATGAGLSELESQIAARLTLTARSESWLGVSAARCRESLRGAVESLRTAASLAAVPEAGDELLAAELRLALDHLGAIVGAVYTDDLLDRIFSKFCIGK